MSDTSSTDSKSRAGKASAAALIERLEHEVDPEGRLHPVVRRQRALEARRLHLRRLAKEAGKVHARRAAERAAIRAAEPQPEPATVLDAVLALDEVL